MLSAQLKIYEAEIARTLGDSTEAIKAAVQATELIERADDAYPLARGDVFSSTAIGLMQLGELDSAQRFAERALEIWQQGQVQHAGSIQSTKTTLANAQFLRGHMLQSVAMFDAIDGSASASESAPPRAARRSGHAKALALLHDFDAANAIIETARSEMCAATSENSLDCIAMTLAAADVAHLSAQLELGEALLSRAQTLLGARDIAPLKSSIARFQLRGELLENPSEASVDALVAAIVVPNLSGSVQRQVVRTLLVLAQQLYPKNPTLAARIAAKAIAAAQSMRPESGGMDRALIALWQAELSGQMRPANAIKQLALALGKTHPWVLRWR